MYNIFLAAMVTTTLLNRMDGDQVELTPDMKHDFEMRPCHLVIAFIKQALQNDWLINALILL